MSEIESPDGGDGGDGSVDRKRGSAGVWKDVRPVVGQIAFACHADRIRRAARVVTSIYDDALSAVGIRLPQLTLLAQIWEAGPDGVGVVELARRMGMDRSAVSRSARIVLRKKWVERGFRSRAFRLTPAGCDAVGAALPHWKEAQAYVVGSLRWDARMSMERCLRKLVHTKYPDPYEEEGD